VLRPHNVTLLRHDRSPFGVQCRSLISGTVVPPRCSSSLRNRTLGAFPPGVGSLARLVRLDRPALHPRLSSGIRGVFSNEASSDAHDSRVVQKQR